MEITCMLMPHFFYQLHRFRDPYIIGHPVIIGDHFSGILDFSPEAEAAGIAINLSLNDALLLSPDAILLKPDYSYYEKQWDRIIDILINHTLIIEDAGLGCAYIKLNSNKYKESIDLFLKKISTLENNQKFNINWGVSNGKFYAFLSALYSNNYFNTTSIPTTFLSSIPIDILPISDHMKQKLLSFGWNVLHVNGHNHDSLRECFRNATSEGKKPTAIIAETVKGKGVSFMENKVEWHHKAPKPDQFARALKEYE